MIRHESPALGIDLFHADNRELMGDMLVDQVAVDAVITDPPYGVAYVGVVHEKLKNDDAPPVWCIPNMVALMKPDTAMYVCTRDDVADVWRHAIAENGLTNKTSVVWNKDNWTVGDTRADFRRQTELVLFAHKGRPLLRPWVDEAGWLGVPGKEIRRDTNLWHHKSPRDRHSQNHPTPKPPEMMERAMLNSTDPDDVVLDPFMGGGPVGVAAVRRGRRYIGIEIEERYFELALANIRRAVEDKEFS